MPDSFRLVMDSMTPEERERAEWITNEPGRGRFYLDGYEAGVQSEVEMAEILEGEGE